MRCLWISPVFFLCAVATYASPDAETRLVEAFKSLDDPAVPRSEVLKQFERIVSDTPPSETRERASYYAGWLAKMAEEDRSHAHSPIEGMTAEEKVQEYVFRLRDQDGQQVMSYSLCDPFGYGDVEDTPAHQLVNLGLAAVPTLIKALHDLRPTRSVGERRDFYYVLTIGDCAEAILAKIAGRTFYQPKTTVSTMSGDGASKEVEKLVQVWWEEVQEKGERAVLFEGVVADSADSPAQARLLAKLDSAAAIEAMSAVLSKSKDGSCERAFVFTLIGDSSPASSALLGKIMREGKTLPARAKAATVLLERGDSDGIPVMVETWKQWDWSKVQAHDFRSEAEIIVLFLAGCGNLEGTEALRQRFPELHPDLRSHIVTYLPSREAPPEIQAAQEAFLVEVLEDREIGPRSYSEFQGCKYVSPRVCDRAAMSLYYRWPERYPVQWRGTRIERDIEYIKISNLWRKAHRLEERPIPNLPAHPLAKSEPNTLAQIRWSGAKPLGEFPLKEGDVITAENMAAAIDYLHSSIRPDWKKLSIAIERPEGLTGIVLDIAITIGTSASPNSWAIWDEVYTKGNLIESDGAGGSESLLHRFERGESNADWREAFHKVFALESGDSFAICLQSIRPR